MSTIGKMGYFLGGDYSDKINQQLKDAKKAGKLKGNKFKIAKNAFNEAYETRMPLKENLISTKNGIKDGTKTLVKDFKGATKVVDKVKVVGGGAKGVGSGILKKMPIIGNALTVAFEIPALFKSIGNGDFGKQAGRSALNIAGSFGGIAAGAALGQIICPIPVVGAIVGGIVGGIAGTSASKAVGESDKLFGKSIADQKEELKEQMSQQNSQQVAFNGQTSGDNSFFAQTALDQGLNDSYNVFSDKSGDTFTKNIDTSSYGNEVFGDTPSSDAFA